MTMKNNKVEEKVSIYIDISFFQVFFPILKNDLHTLNE